MEIYCDGGLLGKTAYLVIAKKTPEEKPEGYIMRIPAESSYEAEAEALREACRLAEVGDTIITDHQGLYTILNDPTLLRNPNAKSWQRQARRKFYESVSEDIRLKSLSFRWIDRGQNPAGHVGSRFARKLKHGVVAIDYLPLLAKVPINAPKIKCDGSEDHRTDMRFKISRYIFRFARWVRG